MDLLKSDVNCHVLSLWQNPYYTHSRRAHVIPIAAKPMLYPLPQNPCYTHSHRTRYSKWTSICSVCRNHNPILSSLITWLTWLIPLHPKGDIGQKQLWRVKGFASMVVSVTGFIHWWVAGPSVSPYPLFWQKSLHRLYIVDIGLDIGICRVRFYIRVSFS